MNDSSEDRVNNRIAAVLSLAAIAFLFCIVLLAKRDAPPDPNGQALFRQRVQLEARLRACAGLRTDQPDCADEARNRYETRINELDRALGIRGAGSDSTQENVR